VTPDDSQIAAGVALILDVGNLEQSGLRSLLTGQLAKRRNTDHNSTHALCFNPSTDCVQGVENCEGGDEVSAVRRRVTVKGEGRRTGGSERGGWTDNYC
jgi:hypothetical protein